MDDKQLLYSLEWVRLLREKGQADKVPTAALQKHLEDDERARLEKSLHSFAMNAWSVVEPDVDFIDGWHIQGIAKHLQALVDGKIPNLLINQPPGTMKSLLCAVFCPAWAWTTKPGLRFIYASYEAQLSIRDSQKCRMLVESKWYQDRWGDTVSLVHDQNMKTLFQTSAGGWRLATSVGGRGTGEHPDLLFVDDAMKAAEAERELDRKKVIDWWVGTMSSRGKIRGVRRCVVGQRLHVDDLPGHILENNRGNWDAIILPMRYEANAMQKTSIGWIDERKKDGELLWPAAFPETIVRAIEDEMGSMRAAGQLQQRPVPAGGALFKREWFHIVEEHDTMAMIRLLQQRESDEHSTSEGQEVY